MWNFDLGNVMHEDHSVLKSSVYNKLFSIDKDGVYTDGMADFYYPNEWIKWYNEFISNFTI